MEPTACARRLIGKTIKMTNISERDAKGDPVLRHIVLRRILAVLG
jgi:hypothetical protein